jgi:hypothetical protein
LGFGFGFGFASAAAAGGLVVPTVSSAVCSGGGW